jgi:pyruvate/2-oxoglutarate dehydrogenase complex dihydrolipoamide acyltransferase (E2) component
MSDTPLLVAVPRENVNDETVKLVAWLVPDGEGAQTGQSVASIETSKAVIEIAAPRAGFVRHCCAAGAELAVGADLFYVASDAAFVAPKAAAPVPEGGGGPRFSAKARALLEKHGLSMSAFAGQELVRESDVLALVGGDGGPRREALPRRKLVEIRYLSAGQNAGLASSVSVLADLGPLRAAAVKNPDWGGSATPAIVSELARVLKNHKIFNAYFEDGSAHYYENVNIGFALDAERGLKVPIIRDADKKQVVDIVREMQDLMLRYAEDELDVAALSDGTFTLSDLAAEGVFAVAPLINYRQAAILALGAPTAALGGQSLLTLVFDHRLTEGRAAAAFLRDLASGLAARALKP